MKNIVEVPAKHGDKYITFNVTQDFFEHLEDQRVIIQEQAFSDYKETKQKVGDTVYKDEKHNIFVVVKKLSGTKGMISYYLLEKA